MAIDESIFSQGPPLAAVLISRRQRKMDNRILVDATTITDTQIDHLRGEAAIACDLFCVFVCCLALNADMTRLTGLRLGLTTEQNVRVLAMTRMQARVECARVIRLAGAGPVYDIVLCDEHGVPLT